MSGNIIKFLAQRENGNSEVIPPCAEHATKIALLNQAVDIANQEKEKMERVQNSMAEDLKKLDEKVTKGFEDVNTKLTNAVSDINIKINNLTWKLVILGIGIAFAPKGISAIVQFLTNLH